MKPSDLKVFIAELDVSQAQLAKLLGVTSRAVSLWISEERAIPGPVESYVRVSRTLPANLRQIELGQLNEKGTRMRDGMFGITFQGQAGSGMGILVFDAGKIYGTDTEGGRYDGGYVFNEDSGKAAVKVKVTFPPNVTAVFGISNPYEWAIDVTASFDPARNAGPIALQTSIGKPLQAQFKFLRNLPDAA